MAANDTTLADDDGEFTDWIEIHNTEDQSVNLDGWHLTDKSDNLNKWQLPNVTLGPGEYRVIFASEKDRTNPNLTLHTNFKLNADGEYLGLVHPDGSTVEFDYGGQYPSQSDDVSYGVSTDLAMQGFFPQASPGAANPGQPISDPSRAVVISEIMYRLPQVDMLTAENVAEEFIELHNRSFEPINVGGWQFTRGVQMTLPDATIPAGGYLVVAATESSFTAKYPQVGSYVAGWQGSLSNSGETIELVDATGHVVDQLRYADEGDWSVRTEGPEDRGHRGWIWSAGHNGGNKSLELIQANHSNDVGQNWSSSLLDGGTPGSINSVAQANVAPFLLDISHSPAVPTSSERVTVTARVWDELRSGASATLFWRVDAAQERFRSTTMSDDGMHGDGAADDGVFGAEIPAQADMSVVEFYVESRDGEGRRRTWPAPVLTGQQQTNALYQVIDSVPEMQPGDPPIYFEVMTTAERTEFSNVNRNSDAQFNATFIAMTGTETVVRCNTGVRIRGSASRDAAIPNNRIRIPADRPWNGITRINVNSVNPVNQVAGSALFRLAGVPAGDAHAVRLYSNGVDLKNGGFYVHAEPLDGEFAENHFPLDSNGNIYRGRRPNESPPGGRGAGLQYVGENPAPYVSYVKNTNSSEADWTDVIRLTFTLNESPDETFVQDIQQVVDVEQWFRAIAMSLLIDNNENGLFTGDRAGDDYAMYRGVEDERFLMIPYDWDTLFRDVNRGINQPRNVPALRRLIDHPQMGLRYYAQYADLIDNVIHSDALNATLQAALEPITTQQRIDTIQQFLVDRARVVRGRISEEITVEPSIPVAEGLPLITSPFSSLSGTMPVAARSISVNGDQAIASARGRWFFNLSADGTESVIVPGSEWKYMDDGSDQGTSWREPGFDDSEWASGASKLGYGDGDEATLVDFGGDPDAKHITTYFRSTFQIDDPARLNQLDLLLQFDDGAAVYINGVPAARFNLAEGAEHDTLAEGFRAQPAESQFESVVLPQEVLDSLDTGENTIAVEVHQASAGSSDLSFNLRLNAQMGDRADVLPGINRLKIRAYDDVAGQGQLVAERDYDIWYDNGSQTVVNGDITGNVLWRAQDGPYRISGEGTVTANSTLTIEPGTTVFFEQDAKLTVRGRLQAIGQSDRPIRFTRLPGTNAWDGLQFVGSMNDSQIQHAIIEYGVTDDGMIGLQGSELTLQNVTLDHTNRRRIRSINSSLVVRDSTFTNIADPGEAPATDNRSEHIWGRGIPDNGQWLLEGNTFGHLTGHNDAIDFDAPRLPGPIPIIRNNVFVGGGDDALDMTGDVYIEGNVFRNFIKDEFNTDPGESNTISASSGDFRVVRNVFDNIQHASLVKEDAFMYFLNNTVVSAESTPLYFDLPGQTSGPGRGAVVQGSLFATPAPVFDYVTDQISLEVSNSYLPSDEFDRGEGNLIGDPHVGGADKNYALLDGSPARGTGPNGIDMGADIAGGATVFGVPALRTGDNSAQLTVAGPDITHYRYRVNDGPFSQDTDVETPIRLTGLAPGQYTVSVIGRNVLGQWQSEADATVSDSWIVDVNAVSVRINEVLVHNLSAFEQDGEFPDAVELFNDGPLSRDLSGYSLSDRVDEPRKYVFSAGSRIGPGEYLVLLAEDGDDDSTRLGFSLDRQGEGLFLFDRNERRVDAVEFGMQLPDHSIGVVDREGRFSLTRPTLGAENVAMPLGDPSQVQINEWYTSGNVRIEDDFIELHNPQSSAVSIGGLWLTDEPAAIPEQFQIAPLSFIQAGGYSTFIADGETDAGKNHTSFRLSPVHEHLALMSSELQVIDQVFYFPQTREVSQGRLPDGTETFAFLPYPSPSLENGSGETMVTPVLNFDWSTDWRYEASGNDLGSAWKEPDYDDSQWESGAGPLGRENERLPEAIETSFPLGDITYYFRKEINIDADPSALDINMRTLLDDGAAFHVNGREVQRIGIDGGPLPFDRVADRNVNEAQIEGPFELPNSPFVRGRNVIAVEVHQTRVGSSDLVFGMELSLTSTVVDEGEQNRLNLLESLRVSEIMYGATSDRLDYVEVQNVGDAPLQMDGVRLDDGVDFEFPDFVLAPGQRAVVAEDAAAMLKTYGSGINVVGEYRGRLSDRGEKLVLRLPDPYETAVLSFQYDAAWYPEINGEDRSIEVVDPSADYRSWGENTQWRASASPGGTPGYTGQLPLGDGIVINEVLTHTDPPLIDAIEIHNRLTQSVDVSGWVISDSEDNFKKFVVPEGTIIGAGGYLVFDENDFNPTAGASPNDFALDGARGDDLWIWKTDVNGQLQRIVDTVEFDAAANGESWGRVPNGTGPFTPLLISTLRQANSAARIGPVVISELHYHPRNPSAAAIQVFPDLDSDDLEYVELFNSSSQFVTMRDWRIRGGIDFDFAADTVMSPGATLLVVSFDPTDPGNADLLAAFRTEYRLTPATQLVGGYTGKLDNGGEEIRLQRPDQPPLEDPTFVPRLLEDQVRYDNEGDWPTLADGQGSSLTRNFPAELGRVASSWNAELPSPGRVAGQARPGDFNSDGVVDVGDVNLFCSGVHQDDRRFDLNDDTRVDNNDLDILIHDYLNTHFGDADLNGVFDSADFVLIFTAGEYEDDIGDNSTWAEGDWNCDGEFTSSDLVVAFQDGGYVAAARAPDLSLGDDDEAMIRDISAAAVQREADNET